LPPTVEILSDLALARRLERAEGTAGARYVEARARVMPEIGAAWTEIAGAYVMFDGPDSPITQTFGLGMFENPSAADLDRIEQFFRDRKAPTHHEVSPMADKSLLEILTARGYQPIELTSILYLPLADLDIPAGNPEIRVRTTRPEEAELWASTAAEGWREFTAFDGDQMLSLMRIIAARDESPCFLAELNGHPIAAGGLVIHEGVAVLAGASTIPEWRKRGAQQALLKARLEFGAKQGCDLAMIGAEPGSISQRNAQRQGFRIAYTRIKWKLASA